MNLFRELLMKEVHRIGWREFLRRADGAFTTGALQGWSRGAFPSPGHQEAIAHVTGAPLEIIRDLVWRSEKAREEERQPRSFRPRAGGATDLPPDFGHSG
jgi:hypothetical protein